LSDRQHVATLQSVAPHRHHQTLPALLDTSSHKR
jgi:hypothetical protein